MNSFFRTRPLVIAAAFVIAPSAFAQDSVSATPGADGDALSPYATQTHRYVLDLVQFQSSWQTDYFVGPITKASRDADPMFNTLALGSAAVSPDHKLALSFASTTFQEWAAAGDGVSPENSGSSPLSISAYDRQFGIAFSDLNADATNATGLIVGINNTNLSRLYVERTVAAHSRITSGTEDVGTISLGSIDADGATHVRADGFNGSGSNQIVGENIVRIDLTSRNSLLNAVFKSGANNIALDAASSTFLINNGTITTNTPAAIPTSAGSPLGVLLDFTGSFSIDGAPGVQTHLDAPIDAHRGNPFFAAVDTVGGIGTVASLARSASGGGLVDSINLFGVDAAGAVVGADSATLPSPMPGFPALNAAGDAEFLQYLSQTSFRGPNGLVAIGLDVQSGDPIVAATATDPTAGDFIAVARLASGGPIWTVVASIGQNVLDGPGGLSIGILSTGSPISISAPAADLLGNVYFVATYDPTLGAPRNALFKAVNTATGYEIELILGEGDQFAGVNSASNYTIDKLALGDSDSLASAGMNASQVLQPQSPAHVTSNPADATAFGGAIVNATITYNNAGSPETYEAILFVGAFAPPVLCVGDVTGDGKTDSFDFAIFAPNFGSSGHPAFTNGDLDGDGDIDAFDFAIFAPDFGCGV